MPTPIITACPGIANPEAFDNVEELRQELHRANDSILQLADKLHEEQYVVQHISRSLAGVVFAHMEGKHDAVKTMLDHLVAKHVKIVQKPEGAVH